MTSPAPQRPFWKRKRWIAAAALWLAIPVLYVLSIGVALFALLRGWINAETYTAYGVPWYSVTPNLPDWLLLSYGEYLNLWMALAD